MLCSFVFPHSEMPAVIQWKPPWSSCPSQATRWICLCYRRWDWDMNTDLFFPWTVYASSFPLTLREWPDVEPLFDMEWDSCHLTLPSLSGFSSSRLLLQPPGRKTPISQELPCLSGQQMAGSVCWLHGSFSDSSGRVTLNPPEFQTGTSKTFLKRILYCWQTCKPEICKCRAPVSIQGLKYHLKPDLHRQWPPLNPSLNHLV